MNPFTYRADAIFENGYGMAVTVLPSKSEKARRIVACLNACHGISTGNLDAGGVLDTVKAERDKLLAALLYVQQQVESGQDIAMSQINEAIRSAQA